MSISKAYLYPETDQKISFYSRAHTHPTRVDIIRTLRREGPLTVQQLAAPHPLTLSAFSQHLELLRETQIIKYQVKHPFLVYSLDEEIYKEACEIIFNYLMGG